MSFKLASFASMSLGISGAVAQNFWFSFGDSYTQTGFNYPGADNTQPSSGNPLGNPPYPGWTATGGENWVDYVTTKYNNSEVLTYNYAYGGAVIDRNLVAPYEPSVVTLTEQIQDQFLAQQETIEGWTSENALFSIWIGINDIGNNYYDPDRDAFSDLLIEAYFALVDQLLITPASQYAVGARNFLFISVPPLERTPIALEAGNDDSHAVEAAVIAGYNSRLSARAASFKAANEGVTTYEWDSYTGFNTILDDYTSYGFNDIEGYGTDPGQFWGNNYHPSSYAHKFFAEDVAAVLNGTIW